MGSAAAVAVCIYKQRAPGESAVVPSQNHSTLTKLSASALNLLAYVVQRNGHLVAPLLSSHLASRPVLRGRTA
jgi:hypothetical protein